MEQAIAMIKPLSTDDFFCIKFTSQKYERKTEGAFIKLT
jgi:hypothetical protein